MPIMLNAILLDAGFHPADVRLLRHKDSKAAKGRGPYELWRDERAVFEQYQSSQKTGDRSRLKAPYWASFVGTPSGETLFVGIYSVQYQCLLLEDRPRELRDGVNKAGSHDLYTLTLEAALGDLIGRLFIDWGPGTRAWIQRADRQNKSIAELRPEFREPEFPGFLNFVAPLSKLDALPRSWIAVLQSSTGIYLLTCPKTREQYVGAATGERGFWHRWQDYVNTGHGGDVALKSRNPADYQVSILEVAGTSSTLDDIMKMESRWKTKLQSREMGLNRN